MGKRLSGTAPFGKWQTQTFIAGLTCTDLIAPWVIKGAMDRAAFDTCIETQLAPTLEPGTVLASGKRSPGSFSDPPHLDNLATHNSAKAAEVLKTHGCWLLLLPACSPDLNPIDMAFSKRKAHLRRIAARTFDQLLRAPGDICSLFNPNECWNFFRAAGYPSN